MRLRGYLFLVVISLVIVFVVYFLIESYPIEELQTIEVDQDIVFPLDLKLQEETPLNKLLNQIKSFPNDTIVITFYTKSYIPKLYRLLESCINFQIYCYPTLLDFEIPQKDKHNLLLSYKPTFILRQLSKFQKPVLYVDCDLTAVTYPAFINSNKDADIMLINARRGGKTIATMSGMLWFNNSPGSWSVLDAWRKSLLWSTNRYSPDDQTLDGFLTKYEWIDKVHIHSLPLNYIGSVFSHPDAVSQWPLVSPVIPPLWFYAGTWLRLPGLPQPRKGGPGLVTFSEFEDALLEYLVSSNCTDYGEVPEGGVSRDLGRMGVGEKVVLACSTFSLRISFWSNYQIFEIYSDFPSEVEISVRISGWEKLGCGEKQFRIMTKESPNGPATPDECATKCELWNYFSIARKVAGEECWCGDVITNSKISECPEIEIPRVEQYDETTTHVIYENKWKYVKLEEWNKMEYFSGKDWGLEHFSFLVESHLSEVSFSKFVPRVRLVGHWE